MTHWLYRNWVTAAAFVAGAFLCLFPLLTLFLPAAGLLLYLVSPGYMIHQVEEHVGDRFRRFFNARIYEGYDALDEAQTLVVNLPLVWGLDLVALYAGVTWGYGYGLAAPYFMLVNALTHVAAAVRLRTYNPGLVTAVVWFVPLGAATVWAVARVPGVSAAQHLLGLGLGLGLHALIFSVPFRRYRALKAAGAGRPAAAAA